MSLSPRHGHSTINISLSHSWFIWDSHLRLLIADDSKFLQERLVAIISDLPDIEIVGQAFDGFTATDLINDTKPDVVLLDIRMPKLSGIDVLTQIKKGKSIPQIIVLTNYPYPQYRKRCTELGADYFFHKDSEFEKLSSTIKALSKKIATEKKVKMVS